MIKKIKRPLLPLSTSVFDALNNKRFLQAISVIKIMRNHQCFYYHLTNLLYSRLDFFNKIKIPFEQV